MLNKVALLYTPLQVSVLINNALASNLDRFYFFAASDHAISQFSKIALEYSLINFSFIRSKRDVSNFASLLVKGFLSEKIYIGNYNSRIARILTRLFYKKVEYLDDGSNTALINFRQIQYIRVIHTYFKKIKFPNIDRVNQIDYICPEPQQDSALRKYSNGIIILGSADFEEGLISEKNYLSYIQLAKRNFQGNPVFYFAHRRESRRKLEKISDSMPIISSEDTFETFYGYSRPIGVVSFGSTLEVTLPIIYSDIRIFPMRYNLEDLYSYRAEYEVITKALTSEMESA